MYIDIFNLLGFDVDLQQTVVGKIDSFLGRLAHRALIDMIKHMKHQDLADMWYIPSINATMRAKLDELSINFFVSVIFLVFYEIFYMFIKLIIC